ncbi:hypothetical protein DAMA08_052200 [Martiniozyma asiatica (nom. inval.)]|nr:hypothetical protein DAMA08_052200 [Martiniozyma asiatica]
MEQNAPLRPDQKPHATSIPYMPDSIKKTLLPNINLGQDVQFTYSALEDAITNTANLRTKLPLEQALIVNSQIESTLQEVRNNVADCLAATESVLQLPHVQEESQIVAHANGVAVNFKNNNNSNFDAEKLTLPFPNNELNAVPFFNINS